MPRLIDADALNKEFRDFVRAFNNGDFKQTPNWNDAVSLVGSAPTVDAVQVVRCGECKWWKCADESEIIRYGDCTHPSSAIRKNCLPNETWFCADGERKEDGDNH